jgi:hypothetical protein
MTSFTVTNHFTFIHADVVYTAVAAAVYITVAMAIIATILMNIVHRVEIRLIVNGSTVGIDGRVAIYSIAIIVFHAIIVNINTIVDVAIVDVTTIAIAISNGIVTVTVADGYIFNPSINIVLILQELAFFFS